MARVSMTVVLLLFAVACREDADGPEFPAGDPITDDDGVSMTPGEEADASLDAGVDGAPAGRVRGKICLLESLDVPPDTCILVQDPTLTVRVAGEAPQLAPNGRFSLPSPTGEADTRLVVTSTDHMTYFGAAQDVRVDDGGNAANVELRIATRETVDDALALAAAQRLPGNGIVMLRFPGAVAGTYSQNIVVDVVNGVVPYYDIGGGGFTPDGGTGAGGTAIYFDMSPGSFGVTATRDNESDTFGARSVADALFIRRMPFVPDQMP